MAEPYWHAGHETWYADVELEFTPVSVQIRIDNQCSPNEPTPAQVRALALIEKIDAAFVKLISTDLKRFGRVYVEDDIGRPLTDEELEFRVIGGLVPPLRNSATSYFFLFLKSEVDAEHGVSCLFKNLDSIRVCHGDYCQDSYEWDAVQEFESILMSDGI